MPPRSRTAIFWESIRFVFGFAAVDGFHVKRVAQDELDSFLGAQIGQPVPAEDAFDGHDQVLAVGLDGFQESLGTGAEVTVQQNLSLWIQDTEIHPAGMQVDAAVESVGLGVESHQVSSSWKLDTSRSISNRYAPRGGLDEYHAACSRPLKGAPEMESLASHQQ